jgi:hypothetical protein
MVEMAFRAYDPCFGCATHSLPGQMPLEVTIRDAEGDCASLGGLSLMERLTGSERVILVDAIFTGTQPVGTVSRFSLDRPARPERRPFRFCA